MADDLVKSRFWWGVLLAWAPWVATVIGLAYMLHGVLGAKATGLGAVAGGISEILILWGIAVLLVSQAAAIVWLWGDIRRSSILRSLFVAVSIGMSGLMLVMVGFFAWHAWFLAQHR
jgi:hypothetical protein